MCRCRTRHVSDTGTRLIRGMSVLHRFQPFIGPPHGGNFTVSDRPFELYIPTSLLLLATPYILSKTATIYLYFQFF